MRRIREETAEPTLLSRDSFREGVFARDRHRCVLCRAKGVETRADDAHHILERRLWREAHERYGYFMDNGASVCEPCHMLCEQTVVSVDEVREAAGITRTVLPAHLYSDQSYSKWGDPVLANGLRIRGELFWDESVQKVLSQGKVLHLYTHLVRFPRTSHVPWSPGISSDDRTLPSMDQFAGRTVVVAVKRDGRNTTVYPSGELHARSPDGRPHPSQALARAEAAQWQYDIPEGWRVCLEDLYRRHSIAYDDLPSWLMGFHVWNDRNVCLPWKETLEWFALLGVNPVETIYHGPYDERILRAIAFDRDRMEGWVVRDAGAIPYSEYPRMVGKFVRPDHNHLHGSRHSAVIPNALSRDGTAQPAWWFDERILGADLAASIKALAA